MPAAIVGVLAGLGALRRLRYHLDAASQRLGGALVVSGLSVVPSAAAGDAVLAGSGLVASAAFWVAWTRCQALRRERRVEWGIRQRVILERSAELHRRRAVLRSGAVPADSPPDSDHPTQEAAPSGTFRLHGRI